MRDDRGHAELVSVVPEHVGCDECATALASGGMGGRSRMQAGIDIPARIGSLIAYFQRPIQTQGCERPHRARQQIQAHVLQPEVRR